MMSIVNALKKILMFLVTIMRTWIELKVIDMQTFYLKHQIYHLIQIFQFTKKTVSRK